MSLKRSLLLIVVSAPLAAVVAIGVLFERELGTALLNGTRDELSAAPMVLEDRWKNLQDVRMMHAQDVARAPGLAGALATGDVAEATRILSAAAEAFPEDPLLVLDDGRALVGGDWLPAELLEATRRGEMPVSVVPHADGLSLVAVAPIKMDGRWLGAAGGSSLLDDGEAGTLAGLTRSDVFIFAADGTLVSTSTDSVRSEELSSVLGEVSVGAPVSEVRSDRSRNLVAAAPLGEAARVAFVRDLERELAVMPVLRRTALWVSGIALAFALLVGMVFAGVLARPVAALADAADRLAAGDVEAPLPRSSVSEVQRVSDAFAAMRQALVARLAELESANRALEDRQDRLAVLQAELVQRERIGATGRLLAQLAHEIRNPIASVRNCIEVVRRKAALEGEAQEFADIACTNWPSGCSICTVPAMKRSDLATSWPSPGRWRSSSERERTGRTGAWP